MESHSYTNTATMPSKEYGGDPQDVVGRHLGGRIRQRGCVRLCYNSAQRGASRRGGSKTRHQQRSRLGPATETDHPSLHLQGQNRGSGGRKPQAGSRGRDSVGVWGQSPQKLEAYTECRMRNGLLMEKISKNIQHKEN